MAEKRKINTFEIDRLFIFLDELQTSGFTISPRQYIVLNDLLMMLIAHGELLDELRLKTLIAPIVCTTPAEQQDFYQRFDLWYISLGGEGITYLPQPQLPRTWKFPTISRTTVFRILAILAVLITLYYWLNFSSGNTGIQVNNNSILIYIVIAFLLNIASRRLWILYKENLYITRELDNQEPVYTKIPVKTYIKEFVPVIQYKQIVSGLRKRTHFLSSEVDIDRTIETALNNKWLEIIYRQRQVVPEYVVLIDRKSRYDQQARFELEVLANLAADGVWLHQYEFNGNPHICFPLDKRDSPLRLKDLHARHPDARLLVFIGGAELINPITGFLHDWFNFLSYWQDRAILTSDKIHQVLLEELRSRNFVVLEPNFNGLASLVKAFEIKTTSILTGSESSLPTQLIERPMRWSGRDAPPEAEIKTLVDDVRNYLGDKGFYWLCATAVYPELRWELTLHLGSALKDDFGQPLINPNTLLRLTHLPWFRIGYMPDWIRLALIQRFEPEQEFHVRSLLSDLLAAALKSDSLDLLFIRYAKNSFVSRLLRLVRGLFKKSQSDSIYQDHIFAKLIIKNTYKKLAVLLPNLPQKRSKDRNNHKTVVSKVVPPFNAPLVKPPRKKAVDVRGMLSIITMLVSLAALTLSMGGASKFIIDVFDEGLANSLDGLVVKIVVLGIAFFFGWVVGLVSIQLFGNLIYSIIITFYAWACLFAVSGLYLKVIQKLYVQEYDSLHYWAYLLMLLGGLFVLICLHLMVEDHDLRPFSIPLLIISVIQLFAIIIRYVFVANPNGWMLFGDFLIFGVMISISALMLAHIGILSPLRDWVNGLFIKKDNSNHNNHHGDDEEDE